MQERQIIISFSAKKQAGKGECYKAIQNWCPDAQQFSFSDSLKRICIDILGLEEWQAYGTDEQKNSLVPHLLWENFPIPTFDTGRGRVHVGKDDNYYDHWIEKTGPMTARETLQYWGTDIFRKQYKQVWADATIRKIRQSQCRLAVITDCRFPNEVEAIQAAGGRVIRLTRNPFPQDKHPSETSLDEDVFDHGRFDAILDNAEMSLPTQCEALREIMVKWEII